MASKKRIFSGIRPSGELHIGNYLGAIKQWLKLQDKYEAFFCIVDEHAITTPHQPANLRQYTLETALIYLAAGINPNQATIFVQSQVPAHAELAWILGTITPLGELERMTQFKEKSRELGSRHGIMAGLLNYPVLMAADILLYQTQVVPVGQDQKQHVELARSIAERFNRRYGKTFTVPEVMLQKEAARIMSLDDPSKKMSKTDKNERGYILLTDPPQVISQKIKAAVTDSGKDIIYDQRHKPAISNLLVIFSEFSGRPIKELEKRYRGKGYEEFKADVARAIIFGLEPIQKRFKKLKQDEAKVRLFLEKGSQKAAAIAQKTLQDVGKRVGFLILK